MAGRFTFTLVMFLLWQGLAAQGPLEVFNSNIDTSYIKTFPKALTLKIISNNKYIRFNVAGENNSEINYNPNGNSTLGLGFNYKWIGVTLAFKLVDRQSAQKYGKTDYYDFQGHFHLRRGTFDLYLQNYQGFYISNSAAIFRGWPKDTYLKRPDIRVFSSGINYTHILFPQRFSYRAAFLQTEVQRKSAGSIILSAAAYYHRITADSSLIPADMIYDQPAGSRDFDRINGITTTSRFGYGYTFVILRRFFVTAALDAGMSYSLISVHRINEKRVKRNFSVNVNASFRMALGYNYGHWFAGMSTLNYFQDYKTRAIRNSIGIEFGNVRFILAYRIMMKKDLGILGL